MLSTLYTEEGALAEPGAILLVWLASLLQGVSSLSSVHRQAALSTWLFIGSEDLNSGLHTGVTSPLPDESSPHPSLVGLDDRWKPASLMYPGGEMQTSMKCSLGVSLLLRSLLPVHLVFSVSPKPTFPLFSKDPSIGPRPYPAPVLAGLFSPKESNSRC